MHLHVALLLSFLMTLDAQLICWQALIRCHEDRECELAYSQYLNACDGILHGSKRSCPSHCINAIIRLNQTSSGSNLETCDCVTDAECLRLKQAVEPCMPRTHPEMGCTEARQVCEEDSSCRASLNAYLSRCGQLFNGRTCTARCRATIEELLQTPSGERLNSCVCDGLERPFCEVLKHNMAKLCAMGDGGVPVEHEDLYEDEDYENEVTDADSVMSCSPALTLFQKRALLSIALTLATIETLL